MASPAASLRQQRHVPPSPPFPGLRLPPAETAADDVNEKGMKWRHRGGGLGTAVLCGRLEGRGQQRHGLGTPWPRHGTVRPGTVRPGTVRPGPARLCSGNKTHIQCLCAVSPRSLSSGSSGPCSLPWAAAPCPPPSGAEPALTPTPPPLSSTPFPQALPLSQRAELRTALRSP